jgi:hypothetical protein
LQELARTHGADVKIVETREKKGWQGNLKRYTMDPMTDAIGEVLDGAGWSWVSPSSFRPNSTQRWRVKG